MEANADLSILQNFKVNTTNSFTNWHFNHEEYEDIPLSFFTRFTKNIKYADLSSIPPSKEDAEFMMVEGNTRKKNQKVISKNYKLTDRKQPGNIKNTRIFSKKQSRLRRWYENANKTKFKEITVKNQWAQIHAINKSKLDAKAKSVKVKVEHIKSVGKLRYLNPQVEKISWKAKPFKENKTYDIKSVSTSKDKFLNKIAAHIVNSQQETKKVKIICSIEFLLALMTVRGSIYPWAIEIEKLGNLIVLDNFHEKDVSENLTYLDLFTTNENTNNSMATDETKIKEFCVVATKMTKIFQELVASGEEADIELEEENNEFEGDEQEEEEEEQDEQKEEELNNLNKYIKISFDKFEIYTKVKVDGVKENFEGELEQYLVRTFVQTETQGAWMKDMNISSGTIITKEYQSNNCSLQKWIFQAKLAGVKRLKLGFIGYDNNNKNRPVILNVNQATVEGLEQTLSVKMDECWGNVKYFLDLINEMDTGTYLLSKAAYTPLSMKMFQISGKEDFGEQPEEEDQGEKEEEEQEGEEEGVEENEEEEMVEK